MCEKCERTNEMQEEIAILVPLLHTDRTPEQVQAAVDKIGNPDLSFDDLDNFDLFQLVNLIVYRAATMVTIIDQIPASLVLGQIAGHVMESEIEVMGQNPQIAALISMLGLDNDNHSMKMN